MSSKNYGLIRRGDTYYARMGIPADVRPTFGQREFKESLKTSELREAQFLAPPLMAKWGGEIAQARGIKAAPPFDIEAAKRAINHWRDFGGKNPNLWIAAPEMKLHRLTRAANPPDLDPLMLEVLRQRQIQVAAHDRRLGQLRPLFAAAYQHVETILQNISTAMEDFKAAVTPPSAMILSDLGKRWLAKFPPPGPKEVGKIEAHIRRLIEFVGDVPVSSVTAMQLDDYLTTLASFPRNRSTALNALPIRDLIAAAPTGPRLSDKTKNEWFSTVVRMFAYASQLDQISKNPAEGLNSGKKLALKRRAYDEAELKLIFSRLPAAGAKHWLAILCYYHGARLTEIGAAKLADFKQDGEIHYFDLTERTLKTETSARLIPLHPAMPAGWLAYVEALRAAGETYLFPELPHTSKYGPCHEFSKWWGRWTREIGVTDPRVCFHSFRHGWKRAARASSVKEELHDVLSGHKGVGGVGRTYGEGAALTILADSIKQITLEPLP